MKAIQLSDNRIIEEIRNSIPEATYSEKGLLSSLYRNRIEPKSELSVETGKMVLIDRVYVGRYKSSIISVGPIFKAPSIYVVSMGFHQTSTATDVIPKIANLLSSDKNEFFYRFSESKDFVEIFLKSRTEYVGVYIFNLIDNVPSPFSKPSLYTGDVSELKSLGYL